jgi:hypothetical protein
MVAPDSPAGKAGIQPDGPIKTSGNPGRDQQHASSDLIHPLPARYAIQRPLAKAATMRPMSLLDGERDLDALAEAMRAALDEPLIPASLRESCERLPWTFARHGLLEAP